ncbi:MAG: hypothetical protein IKV36_05385 [Clostridia bacterium]|nr:hypothetical protein [Clostridia bacterium]
MAEIAIAALFTTFAQEEFTDAVIASVEKVLVIEYVFFIDKLSSQIWDMRIISPLQAFVKRFFVILYKKTYSALVFSTNLCKFTTLKF